MGAKRNLSGLTRLALASLVALAGIGLVTVPAQAGDGSTRDQAVAVPSLPWSASSTTTTSTEPLPYRQCPYGSDPWGYGARWFKLDLTAASSVGIWMTANDYLEVALLREDATTLTPVGCRELAPDSGQTYLRYDLSAGTYYVVVSGRLRNGTVDGKFVTWVDPTPFSLSMSLRATPANDDWASATSVTALPTTDYQDVTWATNSPGERMPSCAAAGENTIWYRMDLPARLGIQVDVTASSALAVFHANGTELRCNRLPAPYRQTGPVDADVTRLRPSGPGEMYLAIASKEAIAVRFTYREPPINDDFAYATTIRQPDVFAGSVLPFKDTQDGVMSSIEENESVPPDTLGTLWWMYYPDHHNYVSARIADAPETTYLYDGYGRPTSPCWFCYRVEGEDSSQKFTIRVFEAYNRTLGREIELDRTLAPNGTVRWLATGGTPYAIQVSLKQLARTTMYITLNPQGHVGVCNYNSCVL